MKTITDLQNLGFIENNSKRINRISKIFTNSSTYDIYDAYVNPSENKVLSFYSWLDYIYDKFTTTNVKVLTHNSQIYTLGFTVPVYEGLAFCYITPTHKYYTLIIKHII